MATEIKRPLADRMRPAAPGQFLGQGHLLAEGMPLYELVTGKSLCSLVLWGPPGSGKTSLARAIAGQAVAEFIQLSAVLSGVKDIRAAVDNARQRLDQDARRTILFVDEVHRFNKAQQDAFLPHVEDGTIVFIGATTENPSFALNNALLSRAQVYVLKALDAPALLELVERTLQDPEHGYGGLSIRLPDAARQLLVQTADGDGRRLLNTLETAVEVARPTSKDGEIVVDESVISSVAGGGTRRFDNRGDDFYNQISALHKAVRGSAPDAALYWLCRMLDAGCDPLYLARRIVRIASEDIGNADPRALQLALNAWESQERLGSPEGELGLAQAVLYLAAAPKSNAVYMAYKAALRDARGSGSLEVPVHLRNAPTDLMEQLDYGREYRYAHDEPDAYAAGEEYFPEALQGRRYYQPVDRGLEIKIAEKLQRLRELDRKSAK